MLIQPHKQVAAIDELRFFGQDLRDDPGCLRRDRYQIAGDIRIVSADPKPIVRVPVDEIADGRDQHQQATTNKRRFRRARMAFG